MPSSRTTDEMGKAADFGQRIEDLVIVRGKCPMTDRNTVLMGYWSLTFEIHKAILCLLSRTLYGAAFALLRPIVESTVRAHVVIMCSEEVLQEFRQDKYKTNLATVGQEIDAYFGTGGLLQRFLTEARAALHSYTHTGLLQLGRRFAGTNLVPNYSDDEIIELIRVATSAIFMVNNVVTKHLRFEDEWKRNTVLFTQWGKHQPAD